MVVAIAGGALQGVEITYLARKAGFETVLLDRRRDAPATGLCHRFVAIDLTDREALTGALRSVDLVLPATENAEALRTLTRWCEENEVPLAFHPGAYAVSSSKSASDSLFRERGIPAPAPWPDCSFPVVVKPDGESGSKGVEVFPDGRALESRFALIPPPGRVLQAYLTGPLYSIEVMGGAGHYTGLQITRLEMDSAHDCKRVLAPASLPPHLAGSFERAAVKLAEAVGLTGIMDLEAVLHEGRLKALEIDARFPSQTPSAVYHSTGFNMVEALAGIFLPEEGGMPRPIHGGPARGSVLEHIRVEGGELAVCGERVMAEAGPLRLEVDFFGAQEALTNYGPERADWVATLMVQGSTLEEAWARREEVVREIQSRCGLTGYRDTSPREAAWTP
jgi:pyrrolysine biosynthesis protein PylC